MNIAEACYQVALYSRYGTGKVVFTSAHRIAITVMNVVEVLLR